MAWSQRPSSSPSTVTEDTAAWLVRLGVTDTSPTAWDGTVKAERGEIVRLSSWRPSPKEVVTGTTSWKLSSMWTDVFQNRSWEAEPIVPYGRELRAPALLVETRGAQPVLNFETAQGRFTVTGSGSLLSGRVTVEQVASPTRLSMEGRENEQVALARGAGDDMWLAWVTWHKEGNEVMVRRHDGKSWSSPQPLTSGPADVFQVRVAGSWAVWAEQVKGNWDLYGRRFDGKSWGTTERLTDAQEPDIHHSLSVDSAGNTWLTWQGFRQGQSDVFIRRFIGGSWSAPEKLSDSAANDWSPSIAADRKGRVHVAWDTYDKGNYDVVLRTWSGSAWTPLQTIAGTAKFEAKVTLACDREDRLWAAWNESGTQWGKDTGLLVRRPATPLYEHRLIAIAVQSEGGWQQPSADLESVLPAGLQNHNESLALAPDAEGRMWVFFRHRLARLPDVPIEAALHGAVWEVWASAYDGAAWTKPVTLPMSSGRSDMQTAVAADAGGNLRVAWSTDGRDYDNMIHVGSNVFSSILPRAAGTAGKMTLTARSQQTHRVFPVHPRETEDLSRIRSYVIDSGGTKYRIYRGDIHRHTELSRDGKQDGSLWDTYRYALDAASLDFLGVSDHNEGGGPDVPYINWTLQQAADIFFVPGRFAPLYGYERSLGYPNGHRNVMFPKRGMPTLKIPVEERQGKTGAKALYEYLRQNGGIAVSHTSATNMGTDWRDNDPEVEPLVEIYQGDRVSAEHEGAPKAASRQDQTSQAGGFRPDGYVWKAWQKGYKLGLQASSDHLSTHISYAATIASDFSRQGLIDAMKKRHSYGATDNIVLDYRLESGGREYLQGDIADVKGDFRLNIRVLGTAPIRQLDIIRSNEYLHNRQNLEQDVSLTFEDRQPLAGESYYYVRVIQTDNQMAWSSPIWVKR